MRRSSLVSLLSIVALAVVAFASTFVFSKRPTLGLDLQGGASVTLTPVGQYKSEALEQAKQIIRNRVDGLGVGEPEITRQGNAIVVSLPGVKDQNKALEVVGQTAELRFRPVLETLPADETTPIPQLAPSSVRTTVAADPAAGTTTSVAAGATTSAGATSTAAGASTAVPSSTAGAGAGKSRRQSTATTGIPATTPAAGATSTAAGATSTAAGATSTAAGVTTTVAAPASTSPVVTITEAIPSTKPADDVADAEVILPQKDSSGRVTARYRLGPTFLTGAGVSTASTDFQNLEYTVNLSLKGGKAGIDTFNAMAAQCYAGTSASCPPIDSSKRGAIAIVLDSVVKSAPRINAQSFQADQIQITGNFKQSEADNLSLVLRYGALPVKLEPQAVQTVSATLGKDSLRAGVVAGLVGVALVILFMFFYYRSLAIVVLAGLCVSAAILWALIAWTNATLTLSGATGIIVSIGVTVDSYVVFFERLKDDVRSGRTLRSSASRGFASAWRTIVAADLVSLIGAIVLYWLTVGSVRGFAFFLMLSTIIDLFVAYFFTRPAVRLLSLSNYFRGDKVLGITTGEAVAGGLL